MSEVRTTLWHKHNNDNIEFEVISASYNHDQITLKCPECGDIIQMEIMIDPQSLSKKETSKQ